MSHTIRNPHDNVSSKAAYGMFIVAVLFAVLSTFLQMQPITCFEHFQDMFAVDLKDFSQTTSLFLFFYALMQIPGGILLDEIGVKKLFPISVVVTLVGYILFMLSNNLFVLGLSRSLLGIGCTISYITGIYIAVRYLPLKLLPLFIALVEVGSTVISLIGIDVFNWLQGLKLWGWYYANLMVITFTAAILVMSLFLLPKLHHAKATTLPHHQKLHFKLHQLLIQVFFIVINKKLIVIFMYAFFTWLIIMSFAGFWLKSYLMYMHHYTSGTSMQLVELYWGGFLVTTLLIGIFLKDLNKCKIAILILAVLGTLDMLFLAIPINFPFILLEVVALLGGVSASGVMISFTLANNLVIPELAGTVNALINMFISLGGFVGQMLFSHVVNMNELEHVMNRFITLVPYHDVPCVNYYTAFLLYPISSIVALAAAMVIYYQHYNRHVN